MKELIIATKNKGKLREIRGLLKDLKIKVTSLSDYPDAPDIEEDGETFTQNALKKAVTIAMYTGKLTLGEDSGLEVKALGNKPGIYSARFSGPNATDDKNNQKLLRLLKGKSSRQRKARYRCCAALVDHRGIIDVVNGHCDGIITTDRRGQNGFGYDPLFLIPQYKKTFGELDSAIKAKISHRAKALKKIKTVLKRALSRKSG